MWGGQSPLNLKCSTYTGLKSLGDLENFGDSNKGWVFPFGLALLKVTKVRGGKGGSATSSSIEGCKACNALGSKASKGERGGSPRPWRKIS